MIRSTSSPAKRAASRRAIRCASVYERGALITARLTGCPKYASAARLTSITIAGTISHDRVGLIAEHHPQLIRGTGHNPVGDHLRELPDLGMTEAHPKQALECGGGVLGVQDRLATRDLPEETLALLVDA